MHHFRNGTKLETGLLRTTEITVLTVGSLPLAQYTTAGARYLFLPERIGPRQWPLENRFVTQASGLGVAQARGLRYIFIQPLVNAS